MKRKQHWVDIALFRLAGHGLSEIGRRVEMHHTSVLYALRQIGKHIDLTPMQERRPLPNSYQHDAAVLEMYHSTTECVKVIAKQLGIRYALALDILHRHGVYQTKGPGVERRAKRRRDEAEAARAQQAAAALIAQRAWASQTPRPTHVSKVELMMRLAERIAKRKWRERRIA